VSVHRNPVNGSIIISAMRNGYRVCTVYYGYTKREAVREFLVEFGKEE
jgi:hypothetical protein